MDFVGLKVMWYRSAYDLHRGLILPVHTMTVQLRRYHRRNQMRQQMSVQHDILDLIVLIR